MKKISSKKELINNLLYTPLIGLLVEVIESKNSTLIGKKGRIVFESENLLHIKEGSSIVKIPKGTTSLKIDYKGKALYMDTRLLFSTTIGRIKKYK